MVCNLITQSIPRYPLSGGGYGSVIPLPGSGGEIVPDYILSDIFASTSATPGSGDGSIGNPYTIYEALDEVQAGEQIGLAAGVYVGTQQAGDDGAKRYTPAFRTTNSGTSENPIHIVAENFAALTDTDRTELRSGATTSGDGWPAFGNLDRNHVFWWGIYTDEAASNNKPREDSAPIVLWSCTGGGLRYCDIRGIDVSWTDNHSGVRCEGAHGSIIQDCYIDGFLVNGSGSTNQAGVLTYSSSNIDISYCEISNCGNNIFWKAGTPQFGMKAHHNVFEGGVDAFRIQLLTDTVRNEIYQNLFLGYTTSAIFFSQTALPNDLPINLAIANNLFYGRVASGGQVGTYRYDKTAYTTDTNLIYNNITLDTNGGAVITSDFNTSASVIAGFVDHQNNCYHSYGNFGGSDGGSGTLRDLTVSNWQNTHGMDIDGIFADPQLVNPAGGIFTLNSGSPCINGGVDILQLLGGTTADQINVGPYITPDQTDHFGIRPVA
jgi:hypothetical protein